MNRWGCSNRLGLPLPACRKRKPRHRFSWFNRSMAHCTGYCFTGVLCISSYLFEYCPLSCNWQTERRKDCVGGNFAILKTSKRITIILYEVEELVPLDLPKRKHSSPRCLCYVLCTDVCTTESNFRPMGSSLCTSVLLVPVPGTLY